MNFNSLKTKLFFIFGTLFLANASCFAHPQIKAALGLYNSLFSGFLHPLLGLDHLLAMIAVGLIGYEMGNKWRYILPASFLIFMTVGGVIGVSFQIFSFAETGILLSLVSLGLFLIFKNYFLKEHFNKIVILTSIILFSFCHGHAHGNEMILGTSSLAYFAGFLLTTSLLHGFGFFIGKLSGNFLKGIVTKVIGGVLVFGPFFI